MTWEAAFFLGYAVGAAMALLGVLIAGTWGRHRWRD